MHTKASRPGPMYRNAASPCIEREWQVRVLRSVLLYRSLVKWISSLSSKQKSWVRLLQDRPTKENAVKTTTFKNRFNGEIVVCKDLKEVQVIDGVEYLLVSRTTQDRKFLMRKDALEKIKVDKFKLPQ
jgi:hypothetical protein